MEQENKPSYNILQPLLLSACMAIGMMVGYKINEKPENTLVSTLDFPADSMMMTGRVEELIRFVENKYVEKVDGNILIDEALTAVFSKLDPHSIYLSPHEVGDVNDQMDGSYNGIGIENFFVDDTVFVSSVLDNSPAKKSGIQPFDKIITIDSNKVSGQSLDYSRIRQMLRKADGTKVKIGVLRGSKKLILEIMVSDIPVRTVSSYLLPEIQTAYIKIDRFGTNTYKEYMEEVEKYFETKKAKHVILDLRDNPGGYLPEATNILCQIFAEKDKLLLYTEGRNSKRNEYKSNGKRFFDIDKVVVLIDENSASASEIIAGAIQDWDRGLVVGRRSFGKGLVQEQYNLNNGGAVRLTVAKYFTPTGRSIQRDYTDRENYDEDLAARYKNGDLFHKDSLLVKNGKKYQTLLLKRPVTGGGGITPDVFISLDSMYKDHTTLELRSYIPEYTYKYVSANRGIIPKDHQSLANWSLPASYISGFEAFVQKESESFKDLKPGKIFLHFDNDVKTYMSKYVLDNEERKKYSINSDEYLTSAIKLISTNRSPQNYK